jgi:hypothetical protein
MVNEQTAGVCPSCSKPLSPAGPGGGRPAKYCSPACRKTAHRAGKRAAAAEAALLADRAQVAALLEAVVPREGVWAARMDEVTDRGRLAEIRLAAKAAAESLARLGGALDAELAASVVVSYPAGGQGLGDETSAPPDVAAAAVVPGCVAPAAAVDAGTKPAVPAPAAPVDAEEDPHVRLWNAWDFTLDQQSPELEAERARLLAQSEAAFAAERRASRQAPAAPRPARSGSLRPTAQQEAIIEACRTGESTVIEAGAGTGKTSTLRLAAEAMSGHGLYLAFNKAIAVEAKKTFPGRVSPRTAHSLAYAETPQVFKARLGGARQPATRAAEILKVTETVVLGSSLRLTPALIARHAMETVTKFCHSDADEIEAVHVPRMNGVGPESRAALADLVVPVARRAWVDLCSEHGRLKYAHDHYFKQWALSRPRIGAGFIFLDEAQDTNPVLARVLREQSCQVVVVGDSAQQIYAWRGAVDALRTWPARHRLQLTKSWRFGPLIANEANLWLTELRANMRLTGNDAIDSRHGSLDAKSADAVLCRTNAEAMRQTMKALEAGRRPALVGGTRDIESLARAAKELQDGAATSHPELSMFESWDAVRDHVEHDESASDLRAIVRLIEDHGADELLRVAGRVVDESRADLAISTAHKAKGREWDKVLITRDFRAPRRDEDGVLIPVPQEEARLSYVAVTRARRVLDPGGLTWIHTPAEERGFDRSARGSRAFASAEPEINW